VKSLKTAICLAVVAANPLGGRTEATDPGARLAKLGLSRSHVFKKAPCLSNNDSAVRNGKSVEDCIDHVQRLIDNHELCGKEALYTPVISNIRKDAINLQGQRVIGSPSLSSNLSKAIDTRFNRLIAVLGPCQDSSSADSFQGVQQPDMKEELLQLKSQVAELRLALENMTKQLIHTQHSELTEMNETLNNLVLLGQDIKSKIDKKPNQEPNRSKISITPIQRLIRLLNVIEQDVSDTKDYKLVALVALLVTGGACLYTKHRSLSSLGGPTDSGSGALMSQQSPALIGQPIALEDVSLLSHRV
tara:strand:+ start:322 stop:1230 length:909 start_codon:yes stop_codon:yes gene_type:complete